MDSHKGDALTETERIGDSKPNHAGIDTNKVKKCASRTTYTLILYGLF